MGLIELNAKNFSKEVFESDKLCVVEFGAKWCPPCKAMKKIMEELSSEPSDGVNYFYIDAERNHGLSRKVAIDKMPQILIFQKNVIKRRVVGYVAKEELEMLISNVQKFI